MSLRVQDIERAPLFPPIPGLDPVAQDYLTRYQMKLNQQLQYLQRAFEAQEIAIAPAAPNVIITWQTPAPMAIYSVAITPNWGTICFIAGRTQTQMQVNFTVAAPGAQLLTVIRVL